MPNSRSPEMQIPLRKYIIPGSRPPTFYGEEFSETVGARLAQRGALRKAVFALREQLPQAICKPDTRLGIEIEVEGMQDFIDKWDYPPWTVKGDGSLRNGGVEFVSAALKPSNIAMSLAVLYAWFPLVRAQPDFSWRTSTHVHLEVNGLTGEELKKLLLLYLLFEDLLFEFSRWGRRETNIFCTPLTRTDIRQLSRVFHAETAAEMQTCLQVASQQIQKYSALNIAHVFGFGTFEFRHLGGEGDPVKVATWVNLLLKLYEAAQTLPMQTVLDNISGLNTNSAYQAFTHLVFGELHEVLNTPAHDAFLAGGVVACKELLSVTPKGIRGKTGMSIFFEKEEARSKKQQPPEERDLLNQEQDEEGDWRTRDYRPRDLGETILAHDMLTPQPISFWNPLGLNKHDWCSARMQHHHDAALATMNEFDLLATRQATNTH